MCFQFFADAKDKLIPWAGCKVCGEACEHCAALAHLHRYRNNTHYAKYKGLTSKASSGLEWSGKVIFFEEALERAEEKFRSSHIRRNVAISPYTDMYMDDILPGQRGSIYNFVKKFRWHNFYIATSRVEILIKKLARLDPIHNLTFLINCHNPQDAVSTAVQVRYLHWLGWKTQLNVTPAAGVQIEDLRKVLTPLMFNKVTYKYHMLGEVQEKTRIERNDWDPVVRLGHRELPGIHAIEPMRRF